MGLPGQEDEQGLADPVQRSFHRPAGSTESVQDEAEEEEERLPLASSLARLAPSHPLLATLLIDPLLVRVARLERALLSSPPAQTLLRLGLATERVVVAVVAALAALAVVRWRAQWRAMVYTLALGDVVRRTVALLAELSPAAQRRRRPAGVHAPAPDPDEEAQHLLSFWLLVALLSLAESFRTRPRHPLAETFTASRRSNSLSARAAKFLHALRHSYLQFIRRYILPTLLRTRWAAQRFVTTYPSFDPAPVLAKLPALPNHYYLRLPFMTPTPSRPRASFPQPRAHPSDRPPRGPGPIPLAWSWFVSSSAVLNGTNTSTGAEIRWSLFKLVLLLLGQRTDALGARNVLWTWGLEPLVAVSAKLRSSSSSHRGGDSEERDDPTDGVEEARLRQEQRKRRRVLGQPLQEPTPLAPTDAVVQDYAPSSVDDSSLEYDLRDLYGYTLANAPPVSPYAWTPRLARVNPPPPPPPAATAPLRGGGAEESAAAAGQSSSISTPRRPRSRNSHSPTPSRLQSQSQSRKTSALPTNSFQLLQSPPPPPPASHSALRSSPTGATTTTNGGGGTPVGVTYRFASAHHPLLLGPRSASGSAASSSSITTTSTHPHPHPQPLTASALALVGRAGSVRTNGRPGSFVAAAAAAEEDDEDEDPEADEDEDDDDDEGLMTPGEEEAEEGQRKWAGIAT